MTDARGPAGGVDDPRRPPIILDLSRLVSRVLHPTPTGIDRVELAYARGLMARVPDRLRFAAVVPGGRYGRLPGPAVARFLDETERRWTQGRGARAGTLRFAIDTVAALRPRAVPRPEADGALYVQCSPHHLVRPALVERILRRERARFVCLVHDLIPMQFPEYARPGGADEHRRRVDTIVAHADGVIANSAATLAAVRPFLDRSDRLRAAEVAHLGTHVPTLRAPPPVAGGRPYFVCVGTIEPRKNHLLLLNLWRQMAEEAGAERVPRLLILGRRGWENEQVVDMLERCPALVGCVEEHGRLADDAMAGLLAGAAALLLPSFAEGYGMPVSEALALGVPVVCSDLPALREAGGDVPDFRDPLDGPGWRRAIDDLARPGSALAAAQAVRRAGWRAPTWDEHIAKLLDLLHRLAP